MRASKLWTVAVCGALIHSVAWASGVLIPKDASLPALAIKSQRVDIRIKDGVANVKVDQVFKNSVDRDLEAIYVFPLPENASIADFAMTIDGKRVSGELVEKDKARGIYEEIVRRMKDPGLLEHMGGNLFRVSVYPVRRNSEQRIELTFSQPLEFESGLYRLVYPLRTGETSSRTLEDFTVGARIVSAEPIKTVYSPSHAVGITRKGDHEAVVGFEENRSLLDRDFVLYYAVSRKDFGLSLLTHAVKGEDGFFIAMIAPPAAPPEELRMAKDVVFVFDTSGSMAGKKIEQARGALAYGIRRLNPGDRFNVIRFSTDVEPYRDGWVDVDDKARDSALEFVRRIEARGGTAIDEALRSALSLKYDKNRPSMILFLTDGKPTLGETEPEPILANVTKANGGKDAAERRIFVFGVGDEVNTLLLDKLAARNGGLSSYVKPEEDIEIKVSGLADKISYPVLTHPVLTVDKLRVKQVHPQALQDLFCGEQVLVFGRYEGSGHVAVRLTGEVNGKKREYVFEDTFPAVNADNEFVPRLWATRRVGHLLDEIRQRGEDPELKQEVVRLGKEYGIMTPYTSYLVLENDQEYRQRGIERSTVSHGGKIGTGGGGFGEAREMNEAAGEDGLTRWSLPAQSKFEAAADRAEGPAAAPAAVPVFKGMAGRRMGGSPSSSGSYRMAEADTKKADESLRLDSGKQAVDLSLAIRRYKDKQVAQEDVATVRHVDQRMFYLIDGVWVDGDYKESMKRIVVKFADEEYFKLLKHNPRLKKALALGEKVIVCLDEQTAVVVE